MFIIKPDSNPAHPGRQRCTVRWVRWGTLLLLVALVLGFGGVGCRGIYRQTRTTYRTDPSTRLKLRIQEAQEAEKRAEQAASQVREQLAKGRIGRDLEPDIDRLEMAILEFRRRMETVRDAATSCDGQAGLAAEIERLGARSMQMLNTLKRIRSGRVHSSGAQLDELLRSIISP